MRDSLYFWRWNYPIMNNEPRTHIWNLDGKTIIQDDSWDIEFGGPEELEGINPMRQVNAELCNVATIIKSTDGAFYLTWMTRDPRRPSAHEFFNEDGPFAELNLETRSDKKRIAHYNNLRRKFPNRHHWRKLSRAEARELIVRFWLPREFATEVLG